MMTGPTWLVSRRTILASALALAGVTGGLPAAALRAQSVTGVVPNWGDLETWTRTITSTREVEHGLGLHLSGTGGVMLVSFAGRMDIRTPAAPPSLLVVMAPPLLGNPNIIRAPSLVFVVDDGTDARAVLDATASVRVDDAAPGAIVRSATGRVSAADFARLVKAKTIKATVFGSDSLVRIDQIKALQALADKLKVK
jgi:hypothetical protein